MTTEQKTTHTPGPWALNGPWNIYSDRPSPLQPDRPTCIASITKDCPSEREANARLIAAAPELLRSLELLTLWAECSVGSDTPSGAEMIREARAAIDAAS